MSGIVHFRHPVIMRHVPPRGRAVRLAFVPVSTPARLTEIRASEMVEAGMLDGLKVRFHADGLWARTPYLWDVGDLVERVSEEAAKRPGTTKMETESAPLLPLARSPLVAAYTPSLWPSLKAPGGMDRLVTDGTDRAREDLAAYLDANVRIVSGAPYVRLRGPLFDDHSKGTRHSWQAPANAVAWSRNSPASVASLARPRLLDDVWGKGTAKRLRKVAGVRTAGTVDLTRLPGNDDDILHFLNTVSDMVLWNARYLGRDHAVQTTGADDWELLHRTMTPWVDLGMLGSVRIEEAQDVLDAFALALPILDRIYARDPDKISMSVGWASKFVGRYVAPALAPGLAPEDEDAMAGLEGPR